MITSGLATKVEYVKEIKTKVCPSPKPSLSLSLYIYIYIYIISLSFFKIYLLLYRDDMSGWKYVEDDIEKRKRLRTFADFEKKLQVQPSFMFSSNAILYIL